MRRVVIGLPFPTMSERRPSTTGLAGVVLVAGLVLSFALPSLASHLAGGTVLVGDPTPGDDGIVPFNCGDAANPCDTINHAVTHALPNDTIQIAPGVYVEQVQIVSKPLRLVGAGAGSTIVRSPQNLTATFTSSDGVSNKPVVHVHDTASVEIQELTVDGDDKAINCFTFRMVGIAFRNSGGAVRDVEITRVRKDPNDTTLGNVGCPGNGIGLLGFAGDGIPRTLDVTGTAVHEYQLAGLLFDGAGLSAIASRNAITGSPSAFEQQEVQAGVEVRNGAVASVSSSTITGNDVAIAARAAGAAVPMVAAHFNRITGNETGIDNTTAAGIDAENNWWGCNAGPNSPGCDTTSGTVDSDPWLVLDVVASPAAIGTGGQTSQITARVTRSSNGAVSGPGFPDGTLISFATTVGTIESPKQTLNGEASTILTSGKHKGTATVSATLDGQAVTTQVAITKPAK